MKRRLGLALQFLLISSFVALYDCQINRSPVFLTGNDMSDFSISENTPVGTLVYTLQGEDPDKKRLNYYISGDSFSVDRESGAVKLITKLDREVSSSIQVIITITDEAIPGTSPNTVSIQRTITVLDENDNPPVFQNTPYSFFVGETVTPGSVVFDGILVSDKDEGMNAKLQLSCQDDSLSKSCEVFEVRGQTLNGGQVRGEIIVKEKLDYEKRSSYSLTVSAQDTGIDEEKRLSSSVEIKIQVKDVQDQPPTFVNEPYSATLKENSQQGTSFLSITAKDGDEGDPRPILLSIHKDDKGYFEMGETKELSRGVFSAPLLTSAVPINREDRNILDNGGLYILQTKATELINGEASGDSTVTNITIVVADVDDQYPVFNGKEFSIDVMEGISSNTPLPGLNIVVWDNDVGKNAQFSLRLRNIENAEGVFSVYPETAVGRTPVIIKLSDASKLDFEKLGGRQMKFEVIAEQEGNHTSTATVVVNVLDVNDNGPKFEQDQYVVKVKESTQTGDEIITLTATDADSRSFGELTYSLKGFGAEKFVVDERTGRISIGSCKPDKSCIDYEMRSSYSLTYTARDGGGRIATINLIIDVIDVNDNAPQFIHEQYQRQIQEKTIEINPPLIIKATDIDGPNQGGGAITYSIKEPSQNETSPLVINPTSGQLSLTRPFRYSDVLASNGEMKFVIVATDHGTPPKSTAVDLHLRVMKENDGAPVFTNEPYSAHVKENSKPGTSVIQVIASDPDGPDSGISYFISQGARDNFVIGDKTGVISIAPTANLDLDLYGSEFKVTVQAVDSGSPMQQTASTTINIHIMDVNNKPPKFAQESYTQYLNERIDLGERVLMLTAMDPDQNAKIRYTIVEPIIVRDKTGLLLGASNDFKDSFRINGTSGEVYVNAPLDYNAAAVYIFNVQAMDLNAVFNVTASTSKQATTAEVTVYIQAYDNKNPVFVPPWTASNPKIEITISEEPPIESELITLSAKDPISGQDISNFIEVEGSDAGDYVSVSPLSGIVTLNRRLDYEVLPLKFISFKVYAIAENQGVERTSEAEVMINIQDINDNSPVFDQNRYKTSILESAKYPQSIVTVHASDEDSEGSYGDITYSLFGQGSEFFTIDPISGTVQVRNGSVLDRESKKSYNLQVTATDNPGSNVNQRKTSVVLTITIADVNDNMPQFTRDTYTAVVPENVPKDISITRVEAFDSDEGDNGRVYYEMLKENDAKGLFRVAKDGGSIFVKHSLAGKGRSEPYTLTIRAHDDGQIPQSNEVDLLVFIGDVATNDGVPQFVKPALGEVASVYENSTVGTLVYQVVAVDPDNPNTANGKVAFRFLEDTSTRDGMSLFSIDPVTGIITTKQYLDREEKQNYTLIVVAYDLGDNPQEATRVLNVVVLDIDDNKPKFNRPLNADPIRISVFEEGALGEVIGYLDAYDEDEGKNAIIEYHIMGGNEEALFGIRRTNDNRGEIYTKKRLDREQKSTYVLSVKVCNPGQIAAIESTYKGYDPSDFGQIRIKIDVEDIDDNKPVFENDVKILGVRVDTDLHSEVATVVAHDSDISSGNMKYYIYNSTFHKYGNTREESGAFVIDENTGMLRTNKPYGAFLGGYFRIAVEAIPEVSSNTTNSSAAMDLTIHVVKDTELMKFVFNKPPAEVRKSIKSFKSNLKKVLKDNTISLNLYDSHYYSDENGRLDLQSTSSCFQLVQDQDIIPFKKSFKLLDHNLNSDLLQLYHNYSIVEVENCAPRPSQVQLTWVEIALITIATFVAIAALLSAVILCCLYCGYKKKLRRATYYKSVAMSRPGTPAYLFE